MMARLPGMSSAAVMPCSARAAMSVPIDGATPLTNDVTANPISPITKTTPPPKQVTERTADDGSDPRWRR